MIEKLLSVHTEKLAWIAVIGLIGLLYIQWMGFTDERAIDLPYRYRWVLKISINRRYSKYEPI